MVMPVVTLSAASSRLDDLRIAAQRQSAGKIMRIVSSHPDGMRLQQLPPISTKPGVQKPHCAAPHSRKASWLTLSFSVARHMFDGDNLGAIDNAAR